MDGHQHMTTRQRTSHDDRRNITSASTNQRHHRLHQGGGEKQEAAAEANDKNPFLHCADLVLPWLTPPELAIVSLTCTALRRISQSVTRLRSLDASRGFETLPIPFINSVDSEPYAHFLYTPTQLLLNGPLPRQPWGSGSTTLLNRPVSRSSEPMGNLADELAGDLVLGCDCESCEREGVDCLCSSSFEGLEGVVSECGPGCGCDSQCVNRVSQRGLSVRLKIVKHATKGWCLVADQTLENGRFVCEYAGELLTTKEARIRQQMYDDLAPVGRFSSALLVVREHLPSGKTCLRINIDATRVGNVARFINHSCDGGNLSTVLVRSTGALLPRLCFFASKDIQQDEELSFSYGEIRLRSKGLQCFCGSSSCFGILPSEHT